MKQSKETALQLARSIAKFVADKKAQDIVILDMRKVANFCDYFVVSTGTSSRQVQGIALGIEEGLHELGLKVSQRQGFREGTWVLIDVGSVVAHIFDKDTREFYGLEYLWQEAKKVKF